MKIITEKVFAEILKNNKDIQELMIKIIKK
jgi:hypothetical protein